MGIFDFLKGSKKAYHHVYDVDDDHFDLQVIQRSYKKPVMVDFWAAWCMPCRKLGPVLERIAMEPDSTFLLAKVDTEVNQRVPTRYQVRSIPAVKIFRNGQVVGEFVGMQLESRIRSFMDKVAVEEPPRPRFKISNNPAKRLKQAIFHLQKGRGFKATLMLRHFPDSPEAEKAAELLPLAQFLWDVEDGDALSGQPDLDDLYLQAAAAIENGDLEEAHTAFQQAAKHGDDSDKSYTKSALNGLLLLLKL